MRGVSDGYGQEMDRWLRAHLYYDRGAAARHQTGACTFLLIVRRDGRVVSASLTGSSGSTALDHAATLVLLDAALPRVPDEMGDDPVPIHLTISFILAGDGLIKD